VQRLRAVTSSGQRDAHTWQHGAHVLAERTHELQRCDVMVGQQLGVVVGPAE
jgi:hypothetical protein